jgi:ribosomal-protein-alanine N-acetyltransferase
VEIVARIHASCFDEAWDAATIRKVLAMPGAFGLAARADPTGDIAGFALARVVADECELLSLGVTPNRRGRGIGGGLLDTTVVRAYALDAAKFHLEVAEDNADALRLYEARGLVSVGRRPEYYRLRNGQRTAALTMRCDLPARETPAV